HHVLPVAIVLDVPEQVCVQRNLARPDRAFGAGVVKRQRAALSRSAGRLEREGFRRVFRLRGVAEVDGAQIVRERAWADRSDHHGPFDIIGDVHGCQHELASLLGLLGYRAGADGAYSHPGGRTAVFLGDLVDRGPDTPGVLRTAMGMTASGAALCVPGNHEAKMLRALRGRDVRVSHGLAESLAQLAAEPGKFSGEVIEFLDGLVSHYVLDGGRLVVAHAGLREEMHGRASAAVRAFALYGDTTGETDEFGLPVRYPWAQDYRGKAAVGYGHTPVPGARWVNNRIGIDPGCVCGGRLTALRYPERELVSVPARRAYYQPVRPLAAPGTHSGQATAPAAAESRPATAPAGPGGGQAPGPAGGGARPPGGPAAAGRPHGAGLRGGRGGRSRAAGDHEGAGRAGEHPRPQRGGGGGGDEPVRGRPGVADLPPSHHGAGARQHQARPPGTPGGRAGRLPPRGRDPGDLRGETHGLAGDRDRLPDAGSGQGLVRQRPCRHRLHPHRAPVLRRRGYGGGPACPRDRGAGEGRPVGRAG